MERNSVLIVGSGMMGCGIACCSALAGNHTVLYDAAPDALSRAKARTGENLDELVAQGLCTRQQVADALALVETDADLEHASETAKVVIEAVFEKLELKQDIFARLDALLPV